MHFYHFFQQVNAPAQIAKTTNKWLDNKLRAIFGLTLNSNELRDIFQLLMN